MFVIPKINCLFSILILIIYYSRECKIPEASSRCSTWRWPCPISITGTKCLQGSCKWTVSIAERTISYLPLENARWKELPKNLFDYPTVFGWWTKQTPSLLQDPSEGCRLNYLTDYDWNHSLIRWYTYVSLKLLY